MDRINADTLALPIAGLHLTGATLGQELAQTSGPTLLVFLRHYGCIFCREMLRDVRKAKESDANYPHVVCVGQGNLEETEKFFERFWPDVPAISDPDKTLYDAMNLQQGSLWQMFGPRVWACGLRATVKGQTIGVGRVIGDPWTMPGLFLVQSDGQILWSHQFEHAGDHPDFARIPHAGQSGQQPATA